MEARQILNQLEKLQEGISDYSYESLNLTNANQLKSSFMAFKNELEEMVFSPKRDLKVEDKPDVKKDDFLQGIAHEIMNPLNGLVGFLNLLKQTKLTEEQFNLIRGIDSSLSQIEGLVSSLFELNHLQSGKQQFKKDSFSMPALMDDLQMLGRVLLGDSPVQLEVLVAESLPNQLIGDTGKLNQILLNLLVNAIKFIERGSIIVQVKDLGKVNQQQMVEIMVADTGIGISDQEIERIFEAHYKAKNQSDLDKGGLGLGLSITKELVTLMGGCISVSSSVGVGTTFKITLPLEISTQNKLIKPLLGNTLVNPDALKGSKILVFEDNTLNSRLLQTMLVNWQCEAIMVENPLQGLDYLKSQEFDLVLLDLRLPLMDGHQVLHKIRNEFQLINLPVVAVSASQPSVGEAQLHEQGFSAFVCKPYNPRYLFQILSECLEKKQTKKDNTMNDTSIGLLNEDLPINLTLLREDCMNNAELILELLNLFKQNVMEYIGRMRIHLQAGNHQGIAFASHKIKSSLLLVEAKQLTQIADKLFELANQSRSEDEIQKVFDHFLTAYKTVENAIDKEIKKL